MDNRVTRSLLVRNPGEMPVGIELPGLPALTRGGAVVLGCGAEIKNTFCIVSNGHAYVSWDTGNLAEYECYDFFVQSIGQMCRILGVEHDVVAHDLHPDYFSTRYARTTGCEHLVPVQHHHAHVVAAMAEHGLVGPVLGIALDGMGLGDDGTMWGGEFLLADLRDYDRVSHFKPYPLPGGDEATRNPVRMALSCLVTELGDTAAVSGLLPGLAEEEREVLRRMIQRGIRCPLTSSAGRLFDAVSALLGLCTTVSYEAEAAMMLQREAERCNTSENYAFEMHDGILDFGPMIRSLAAERAAHGNIAAMAKKFHNTIAEGVTAVCRTAREDRGVNEVVLVGGVFQNTLLHGLISEALKTAEFDLYAPCMLPPTDAALSLGQAVVAAARCNVES